ncbi:MAG: hypothetical protein V1734_00615 [Nanoarchaeota archaeon]
MTYTPKLLIEYRECERALLESERLLGEGNDMDSFYRLEQILLADTDAMAMLKMHRDYGKRLPAVMQRLNERLEPAREQLMKRLRKPGLESAIEEQDEFHNFWIEPKPDYYLLSNLPVANKCYNVLLFRHLLCDGDLLSNGEEHTREEWQLLEERGGWRLPDVKLFHAVMRAVYRGSKSNNPDLKRCSMELKDMLMNDLMAYPLMTTTGIDTSMGQVISIQGISFDKSGKQVYAWDGALSINSNQKGLILNGDDFYKAMQKLLKADFNEAKKVYKIDIGKDGFNLFGIPTEVGLTLPETSGIVTLRYERAADEGGPYALFHINGNNSKDRKARARGFRVFNVQE